ncbi:MAG: GHKL domain-containing protein [Neisseriaceae bacterium]|nr:GHKL domain-containing protein [Neisseriaceae bacterium]
MRFFLIFSSLFAVIVLSLLARSTDNNSIFAPYFWVFASCATLLSIVLFATILRYLWLLFLNKKHQVFGSQITRRLVTVFILVTVLPALFLLLVSAQFIVYNINSWFDDNTKQALSRSLNLSKQALDNAVAQSNNQAIIIKNHITDLSNQNQPLSNALNSTEAQSFDQIIIWQPHKNTSTPLAQSNPNQLAQPEIDDNILTTLQQQHNIQYSEQINHTLFASTWISLPEQQLLLFFRQKIPNEIAKDAQLIESAWHKYAELAFAQKGLQTFFVITLTIAGILAVLLALTLALYFSRKFTEPILLLAQSARATAKGDFSQHIHTQQKDELGKLINLFNHMNKQLSLAKSADEQHRNQIEAAHYYLECVLANLHTGIVMLDASGSLKTFNQSAQIILDVPLSPLLGQTPAQWQNLSPQHFELTQLFQSMLNEEDHSELTYNAPDETRILSGKTIKLPEENDNDIMLVFDDITTLVNAQKEAAWGEVATRFAHEIRNPLTPIQLSAERLTRKLHNKLSTEDANILTKSTNTIVKQVEALQKMVTAFRNYARAPSPHFEPLALNQLIEEILVLYESINCQFSSELAETLPTINADHTAIRQVLHNLLKNAAEAAADAQEPLVNINTQYDEQTNTIIISICNNGKSFSKEMLKNAFEPYATDKPTGTGLGLPVVKKIIEEHSGKISINNLNKINGACVIITLPALSAS